MKPLIFPSIIFCFFLFVSCEKENKTDQKEGDGKDRSELLARYADSLVIPAYDNFELHLNNMLNSANQFMMTPDSSKLVSFRMAFQNAYLQWQKVELFDFGPAETHTLRNFYNIYPADIQGINNNISSGSPNLEVPASYPQQGFPALDYLLNGVGTSDSSILAFYNHPSEGSSRLSYITKISQRMSDLLQTVLSEWSGAQYQEFKSRTGLDINSSTSKLTNGIVLHFERFIRSGKVGIPAGILNSDIKAPEKAECYYTKGLSKSLLLQAHQSYMDFFLGKSHDAGVSGTSLSSYLDALGAKDNASGKMLSTIIFEQMQLIETKIKSLGPDIAQEVVSNPTGIKDLYNDMQTLVRFMKVDMTSAMSITITYTDNDGD